MITRRQIISMPAVIAAMGLPRVGFAKAINNANVTICLSLQPTSLDPTNTAAAANGEVVLGNILEGLTRVNQDSQVAPLLAYNWLTSNNNLNYQFRLRQDVSFHDGAVFNAQVVAFNIDRVKKIGPKNKLIDTYNNIKSVEIIDDYTIEIGLHNSDPLFLFRLGQEPAVMLHPDSVHLSATAPIGTGPYKFTAWHTDGSVTMRRWRNYYGPKPAQIDSVKFIFISDPERQLQAVEAGDADVLFRVSYNFLDDLGSNPSFEVVTGSSSAKGMLALNNKRAGLDDVRIRRAITHAIDREYFIDRVLGGFAQAIGSHFTPTEPDYIDLTSVYSYDPKLARELIAETGLQGQLNYTLSIPPVPYSLEGGPLIAEFLMAVGINIKIEHISWEQWINQVFQGDFDLSMITHVEPLDYPIYTRSDYYFGYDSQEFNDLVSQHNSAKNPRTRKRLFMDIQRQLTDDAVNAWIYAPQISAVIRRGLKGVPTKYPVLEHNVSNMYWD